MDFRKTDELLFEFLEAWFEEPRFEEGTRRIGAVTFAQEALMPLVAERLRIAGRAIDRGGMIFYLDSDGALCLELTMTPEELDEKVAREYAARVQELRAMPYTEYLQTPEWKAKRLEALHRDSFACRLCGATDRLHVHHRRYDNRGNEPLDDLTTLCAGCHRSFHENGTLARPTS